ncbi:hypothetical protein [Kangiella taiwanensis]|uniref:hypothetical protein n=1 Tax=Kangiella taiwanensis TaxID=1079179 RepID=UPI001CC02E7A|nr:hypothetical protein [Kangiella taiwanensis]
MLLVLVDVIHIFFPDKYLQRHGGYSSSLFAKEKVAFALSVGANPNLKIDGEPKGENPFFVSYVLERSDLVRLMLPHMNCENLLQVKDHQTLYSDYFFIVREYEARCH